jgi:hypothetical protein
MGGGGVLRGGGINFGPMYYIYSISMCNQIEIYMNGTYIAANTDPGVLVPGRLAARRKKGSHYCQIMIQGYKGRFWSVKVVAELEPQQGAGLASAPSSDSAGSSFASQRVFVCCLSAQSS